MTQTTIIKTQNLTKNFGTNTAVNNLTLTIQNGVIFGFLGPNGAGKTTTIHLLLGIIEPTSGQAQVIGLDIKQQATKSETQQASCLNMMDYMKD